MIFKLSLYLLSIFALGESLAVNTISYSEKSNAIESLQPIQLLNISDKLKQSYLFLTYGEGKKNHIELFLKRAKLISQYLQDREGLKVPEYVVVVDELIKYLNKYIKNLTSYMFPKVPQDDETYLSFMDILESLKLFIESVRADVDNEYVNLKYQDVIKFLLKVSLFTQELKVSPYIPKNIKFLSEVDDLELMHLMSLYKIEKFVEDNDNWYYKRLHPSLQSELEKIHPPGEVIEIHEKMSLDGPYITVPAFPTRPKYLSYPFYFILVGGGEHLNFEYFKSLPLSHFIHIPDSDHPGKNRSLKDHLAHDIEHSIDYLELILDINIIKLITSDSADKYSQIERELLKSTIWQGVVWDSLKELFETSQTDLSLTDFIYNFFYAQHEATNLKRRVGKKTFINDYSPNDPQSLMNFLTRFLMKIQEETRSPKNIDIQSYVSRLEVLVNQKLESYGEVHNVL